MTLTLSCLVNRQLSKQLLVLARSLHFEVW